MEKSEFPPAFLNVAKPAGITAHDVVNRVRRITGVKQVGHAGTLDPAATGVLPIAVGKACRLLRFLNSDKVYVAEILLGTVTDTDDLQGKVIETSSQLPQEQLIAPALQKFSGPLKQLPPMYSAVHYQGQRLYELARRGIVPPDIKLREVTVYKVELLQIALPVVQVSIHCSSGTYIRSIARDLGADLGCGGCLQSLIRQQAGPFQLAEAIDLDKLQALKQAGDLQSALISPLKALPLPCLEINELQVARLLQGQNLHLDSLPVNDTNEFILAAYNEAPLAILKRTVQGELKPEVVIGHS